MLTKSEIIDQKRKRSTMENLVDITFYVPCYNEEKLIYKTLEKIRDLASEKEFSYEILVFNDGSKDRSMEEINRFIINNPAIYVNIIDNQTSKGLGFNYFMGAFEGVGKHYMMICGDDSETKESLRRILSLMNTSEIVIPYFLDWDTRILSRRILSRVFTQIVNLISGHQVKYFNGVVLHKRENVMRWKTTSSGFAYQADLLCEMLDRKIPYTELQIDNNDREGGVSRAFRFQNILSVTHSLLQIFLRRVKRVMWPI